MTARRKWHWIIGIWLAFAGTASVLAALPGFLGDGQEMPSLAPMLKKTSPAVVNIATYTTVRRYNPLMEDPFFRRFFNFPEQRSARKQVESAGSGVIVDGENGYVLTNHHVIKGADQIQVTLADGRTFIARHRGSDPQVDLAVLQIEAEDLTEIVVRDSADLEVGDFVIAIGNPFGLGQTVTSGIVSALGRSGLGIEGYEDFIQTDASINPGNSGGALVNLRGELVGINTAIIAPAGGNVGIGFAIPTAITSYVMDQLITHGQVRRGMLGVTVQDMNAELAQAFGLKTHKGVLVTSVAPESAASQAGMQPGDVIVAVNGRKVKQSADLRNRIGLAPLGSTLDLTVIRKGEKVHLQTDVSNPFQSGVDGGLLSPQLAGVLLEDAPGGRLSGVVVTQVQPDSAADRGGLRQGDRIFEVNRQAVDNLGDLNRIVQSQGSELLFRLQRGNRGLYLVLR